MLPGARHGLFVDRALGGAESAAVARNISLRAIQTDVALALLLRIVKRMRVQEGPYELPADIFQSELEMGVLVNGVMSAEIGGRADHHALLLGDFLGTDQPRRIAGARRRDRRIKRVREMIAQSDARRRRFHLRALRSIV